MAGGLEDNNSTDSAPTDTDSAQSGQSPDESAGVSEFPPLPDHAKVVAAIPPLGGLAQLRAVLGLDGVENPEALASLRTNSHK